MTANEEQRMLDAIDQLARDVRKILDKLDRLLPPRIDRASKLVTGQTELPATRKKQL